MPGFPRKERGESPVKATGVQKTYKKRAARPSRCAVKAFGAEERRALEAWTRSGVPASVSPPRVSAHPRVFAAIAASALDAAARLAVF